MKLKPAIRIPGFIGIGGRVARILARAAAARGRQPRPAREPAKEEQQS
jgi:hypothetical protein